MYATTTTTTIQNAIDEIFNTEEQASFEEFFASWLERLEQLDIKDIFIPADSSSMSRAERLQWVKTYVGNPWLFSFDEIQLGYDSREEEFYVTDVRNNDDIILVVNVRHTNEDTMRRVLRQLRNLCDNLKESYESGHDRLLENDYSNPKIIYCLEKEVQLVQTEEDCTDLLNDLHEYWEDRDISLRKYEKYKEQLEHKIRLLALHEKQSENIWLAGIRSEIPDECKVYCDGDKVLVRLPKGWYDAPCLIGKKNLGSACLIEKIKALYTRKKRLQELTEQV